MMVTKEVQREEGQKEGNDLLSTYKVPGLSLLSSFLTFSKVINFFLTTVPSILSHTFFQGLSTHWQFCIPGVPSHEP